MAFSDANKLTIEAAIAKANKRTSVDGTTRESHSISELIAAREYMEKQAIAQSSDPFSGFATAKMLGPSANGTHNL